MPNKQQAETVSIILPVYNGAEHLDSCIQSVLNQTHTDWELIIVDDGSTDETSHIINRWAKKENKIRTFYQTNAGVSTARNRAFTHSRGKYVTMLDADDELIPSALEHMVEQMTNNEKVDMVTSGFSEMYVKSGKTDHRGGLLMGRKDHGLFPVEDAFVAEYMHCGVCSKLYKREIIERAGVRYQEDMGIGEDHLFALQYLQHCRTAAVLQEEVYHYIHWSDSAISKFDEGALNDQCYIDAVTLYSTRISPPNKKWAAALLSHFLRMRSWVKRIITTHRPHDWPKIRKAIDSHLPELLYKSGLTGSLRMLRRWLMMQ